MPSTLLVDPLHAWCLARCFMLGTILPIADWAHAQGVYGAYGYDLHGYAEPDDWQDDYDDDADENFDRLEDDFGYYDAYGVERFRHNSAGYDRDYYLRDDYGVLGRHAGETEEAVDERGLVEADDADEYFGRFDEDFGDDDGDLGYDYDDLGYGDGPDSNPVYYYESGFYGR